MLSKSFLLFLPLLLFAITTARPTPRKTASAGPLTPIQNVSDPKVQYFGRFAVEQYDETSSSHLTFIKVSNGTTIYISIYPGFERIWWLWLKAKNCSHHGPPEMYEASVREIYNPHVGPNITYSFGYLRPL